MPFKTFVNNFVVQVPIQNLSLSIWLNSTTLKSRYGFLLEQINRHIQ